MLSKRLPLLALAAGLAAVSNLHANSPTVGETGKLYFTPSISFQTFDEFYVGKTRSPLGSDIDRTSFRLYFDYGLTENWAADGSIGYFRTESAGGDQDGLADTYLGVRRALTTQANQGVDVAVRLGFTVPGDYETGQLSTPGDDAYGADLKLLAGRSFGGTRVEAAVGYAVNEGNVPEAFSYGVKVIQQIGGFIWIDAGYRAFESNGDLDIGGPGFTFPRLPEVSERGEIVEVGIAASDAGGRYYRVYASELVDGENIGREKTFGASVTFAF